MFLASFRIFIYVHNYCVLKSLDLTGQTSISALTVIIHEVRYSNVTTYIVCTILIIEPKLPRFSSLSSTLHILLIVMIIW
jgi:hypothetical protein